MAVSKEDVLEFISGLSVLELSELVKEFEEKYNIDLSKSYAYGDTSGDITMFKSVGIPYAINPTKELLDKVMKDEEIRNKIKVIVERKDVTYSLDVNCINLI